MSPTSVQPSIEVHGVEKSYRRGGSAAPVLRGVDLAVAPGECVFLAGPSGSGKTTLLSILGCILTPDAGEVRILGDDVSRLDLNSRTLLRRDRLGFVFQRFNLIRGLTAVENVAVPLTLRGISRRAALGRAKAKLDDVGLSDRADDRPERLSTGQCQRVALARALAGDPEVILADEPTASLDAARGQEAMQLLRQLSSEQGKAAVVVTHDSRIFHFADRICRLENGRIEEQQGGPPRSWERNWGAENESALAAGRQP
jgi:putative ABC transport system ATP-binding protein